MTTDENKNGIRTENRPHGDNEHRGYSRGEGRNSTGNNGGRFGNENASGGFSSRRSEHPQGERRVSGDPAQNRRTSDRPVGYRTDRPERTQGERRVSGDPAQNRRTSDRPGGYRTDRPVRPQGEKRPFHKEDGAPFARRRPSGGTYAQQPVKREDVSRMLAFKALQDVFREGAYSSLALNARLRESTASAEDKRLATAIFYEAVENRMLISYIVRQFAERVPDTVIEDVFHIAVAQIMFMDRIPAYSAVDEAVKMTRKLGRDEQSGFVNGVLRSLLRAKEAGTLEMPNETMPYVRRMSISCSVPETLVARLVAAYGEEFTTEMLRWKPDERIESVRANSMLMDQNAFEAYCEKKHWSYENGMLDGFMLVKGAGDLAGDPDFRRGMYSVQGAGSALAALAVGARPGMQILDACSAPGGKTCLMAERMRGAGRIIAWDVHEHRVELVKAAARRLGLDNIRPAVHDASVFKPDMENTMDAVLIDAPCSGLGVMINKPDVKYNYKDTEIADLAQIQKSILSACARYVKVGGTLVYSTCTVIPEENAMQIEHFLRTHGDYVPDDDCSFLPEQLRCYWHDGMIQLHAHRDGTEGFFIAKLKRVL